MDPRFHKALACARHFRKLGLCPLPSKMHLKAPDLATYAEYWTEPVPDSIYSEGVWRTANIQILSGSRTAGTTKIVVVDLDGPEAVPVWAAMCRKHGHDASRTWAVRTGSGGTHIYYCLPAGTTSCPSGMIWGLWDTWGELDGVEAGRGKWAKHKEIRILGDNALIVAPPSIHVDTGEPYGFLPGMGPRAYALPAIAPDWLLAMPRLVAPRTIEPPRPAAAAKAPSRPSGAFYRREEVLAAIPDKIALAKSWGLQLARETPNPNGWVMCFVPGREDPRCSRPSGSFHADDGTFQDRKDNRSISLFDLGCRLRPAWWSTWQECRDALGDQFLGRKAGGMGRAYGGMR